MGGMAEVLSLVSGMEEPKTIGKVELAHPMSSRSSLKDSWILAMNDPESGRVS